MTQARIVPLGESAFLIRLSDRLDREINSAVRALGDAIASAALPGVTDVVAANSSVGVYIDTPDVSNAVRRSLEQLLTGEYLPKSVNEPALHEIPVRYEGADLHEVAALSGLSTHDVISIHSGVEYQVFAIGFAPGFAYMGEVDERISVPRRANPRISVQAGSVAIANRQTAIYPTESPGGWNIIGTTSILPFDIGRDPPVLFRVGDRVRFLPA